MHQNALKRAGRCVAVPGRGCFAAGSGCGFRWLRSAVTTLSKDTRYIMLERQGRTTMSPNSVLELKFVTTAIMTRWGLKPKSSPGKKHYPHCPEELRVITPFHHPSNYSTYTNTSIPSKTSKIPTPRRPTHTHPPTHYAHRRTREYHIATHSATPKTHLF